MGLFSKKKRNELSEEEKQKRYKKYYDYGVRLSLKWGLPQKVEKANAFYAKHPKSVSFSIIAFFAIMMIVNNLLFSYRDVGSHFLDDDTFENVSATPLISALDKQINNSNKVKEISMRKNEIKYIVDSLSNAGNLSHEDSTKLMLGQELLKILGENKYENAK